MVQLSTENVINLYNDGYSMEAIGKIYNCSRNPIERLLKNNKISSRIGKKRLLTNKQSMVICKNYVENKTIQELASDYNCSVAVIFKILKRNNILSRRTGPESKYKTNLNFFKKINCEANAYFLGFIYADGNVSKKLNYMTLNLHKQDEKILEIFRNLISPDYLIKKNKNGYVVFQLCQTEIVKQLNALGCVPAKSLILKFPTCIPDHLLNHFLRGYSDGDGCISKYKKNTLRYSWDIISTNEFCNSVKNIIKNICNIHCTIRLCHPKSENKITSRLSVGGNLQVEKVLDWLYKDATIYLPRKYVKYLELKNCNQARSRRGIPLKGDC